jgi:hypothetical protein
MQVAMIGQSERVHPMLNRAIDQLANVTGAIQEAVMAMAMKMDEGLGGSI